MLTTILGSTALSFGLLVAIFVPLERAFPIRAGQRLIRPSWWTDLCFFLGQYLLFNGMLLAALVWVDHALGAVVPLRFRAAVAAQPWWLQAVEVVLLSDLASYWAHRLQHRVGILWRFHAVHHSAEHLDWLAAHREHPIDGLFMQTAINLPALVMGFPVETLVGLVAFRGLWAIYVHSNVRLPIGPMRWILGSPELHRWHHDRDHDAGNYANVSPIMDLVFGTYECPDAEPVALGLREPLPTGYAAMLIAPLLPSRGRRESAPLPGDARLTPAG